MTDPELALLTAAGGTLAALSRWAVGLWATVRREDICAAKETNARMVDALREQAASNATLAGKLEQLSGKLDTLVTWRERTPVEGYPIEPDPSDYGIDRPPSERRTRTSPRGYRAPRPGEHDD